jgi:multidrug efflux system membrane fusion protein
MKRFIIAIVALLVVVGGLVGWRHHQQAAKARVAAAAAADAKVPVLTAEAISADVPVTLDGIGTVQALNTVNIRPMVNGPLIKIGFHEGQDVHTGDVLARIDPRTYQAAYDQAVAKKAQDEATLANAIRDLARYDKLAKSQYGTAQQADTQRATVTADQAQVQQDQAQIDSARTNLDYTTIKSPVDGRTGIRQVDVGNLVSSTDTTPITVVATLKPIFVVFTLPQQTLQAVSQAMESQRADGGPIVEALPQNGDAGTVLDRGHLAVLDNQVDQNTGTIKLKAIFPNPDLRLWPGAFVNVRLRLRVDHGVTTVPTQAVQRGSQGAYVFLVDAKGTVTRRTVTVSHQDDTVAVVSTGLSPGDTVVTDGASRLTDGAHVNNLAP